MIDFETKLFVYIDIILIFYPSHRKLVFLKAEIASPACLTPYFFYFMAHHLEILWHDSWATFLLTKSGLA